MRQESDCIGELKIPEECYYGIHTKRGLENFCVSGETVSLSLIYAIVKVKKAAALTHGDLGLMEKEKAAAIVAACDDILQHRFDNQFVTDAYQGGAGTTTHMNVNEVIANVALEKMGLPKGSYDKLSPFNDVNMGQSTNDVYPTALRIAAIEKVRGLSDELSKLQESLQQKELAFADIKKLGRTQLMDALPVSLGEEFGAYAQSIGRDRWRIYKVEERLRQVNLGGTAVGSGLNANRQYTYQVIDELRNITGYGLARAEYPMDLTQNNDVFVEVSGLLKSCAVNLMKISNDFRLMNSGPLGGLGEIALEPRQAGSTIMPGKINPVIPEMVTQISIEVMSNDSAITMAAASGQLELNAFLPLIAHKLLKSLDLLEQAVKIFREKAVETLKARKDMCEKHLTASLEEITRLGQEIGYDAAAGKIGD